MTYTSPLINSDNINVSINSPLSYRNKLINGNFDFWQRGATALSTTGNRYLADRWTNVSVTSTYVPSRQSFVLGQAEVPNAPAFFHRTVVTSGNVIGSLCLLEQRIENVKTCAGQTVTVSFYAKADAAKFMSVEFAQNFGTSGTPTPQITEIGVKKISLSASWQKFTVTATLPSISGKVLGTDLNDHLRLLFWFDAGSTYNSRTASLGNQSGTFDIAQVQLELGSQATAFELRPTALELQLCQRYYEKSYEPNETIGSVNYQSFAPAFAYGNNVCRAVLPFKVQKRTAVITPVVTLYSYSGTINKISLIGSGMADVGTSVTASVSKNGYITVADSGTGFVANTVYFVGWTADYEL